MPTVIDLPADGDAGSVWPEKFRAAIRTVRDAADSKAAQTTTPVTLFWNATTDTWPAVPTGLPAGTVIEWDSLHDATATPPPIATVGFRWLKRDA